MLVFVTNIPAYKGFLALVLKVYRVIGHGEKQSRAFESVSIAIISPCHYHNVGNHTAVFANIVVANVTHVVVIETIAFKLAAYVASVVKILAVKAYRTAAILAIMVVIGVVAKTYAASVTYAVVILV